MTAKRLVNAKNERGCGEEMPGCGNAGLTGKIPYQWFNPYLLFLLTSKD